MCGRHKQIHITRFFGISQSLNYKNNIMYFSFNVFLVHFGNLVYNLSYLSTFFNFLNIFTRNKYKLNGMQHVLCQFYHSYYKFHKT